MAAIAFDNSPSNGDTVVANGVTYTYDSTAGKWKTTINSNAFLPLSGGTVTGNILMGGEIQHEGDTDTNIAFDTDTILFDTAGSERFRVGSAGQLGIGGATYGTDGQVLTSTGATTAPAWEDVPSNLTRGTAVDVSSATEAIFDSLPAGIQRLTVSFHDVSPSAGSQTGVKVQLRSGSGTTKTTGYSTFVGYQNSSGGGGVVATSDGFYAWCNQAAEKTHQHLVMTNITGTKWVYSLSGSFYDTFTASGGGIVDLGAELTGIKCSFPSANFDSGLINIHYEI